MANDRLRTALLQKGMTPAELAEALEVDPKTIERWITVSRVPYRRYRHRTAVLLGVDESYLWPSALPAEQVAAASESEILVVHPHRWAVPRDAWRLLFDSAEHEIGMLVYSGLFIADDPGMLNLIRTKASNGVRVRFLIGNPDSAEVAERGVHEGIDDSLASKIRNVRVLLRPMNGVPGVEIRQHSTILYNSIYRADGQLLVNSHIYGQPASQAPVAHLRQIAGGTLVTTYLESFERVWSESDPLG